MGKNRRSEGSQQPQFLEKPPQFFKIVFSPLRHGIKIPTAFVRYYGDSLNEVVFLEVPTGDTWPVRLLQTDAGTWLDKGWEEFAACYSIKLHHFLLFRYDGDSHFHVVICDKSATEIEYPTKSTRHVGHEEDEGDSSLEILGGISAPLPREIKEGTYMGMSKNQACVKKRELDREECADQSPAMNKKHYTSRQIAKLYDIESHDGDEQDISVEILGENSGAPSQSFKGRKKGLKSRIYRLRPRTRKECSNFEGTVSSDTPPDQSTKANTGTRMNHEQYMSYQKAQAFKSENPFFIRLMQPSYVTGQYCLNLKNGFARDDFPRGKQFDIKLRVPRCRKAWTVKCHVCANRRQLRRGWMEFVLDNNLVEGDACVFELIKGTEIMFNVVIYKNA